MRFSLGKSRALRRADLLSRQNYFLVIAPSNLITPTALLVFATVSELTGVAPVYQPSVFSKTTVSILGDW